MMRRNKRKGVTKKKAPQPSEGEEEKTKQAPKI